MWSQVVTEGWEADMRVANPFMADSRHLVKHVLSALEWTRC